MSKGNFPHPLLLTALTQASVAIISAVLVRGLRVVPLQHEFSTAFYLRNIATVGFSTAVTMCLGNSTYLFLSMAFIEILKGFAPVVTMMVQALFGEGLPRAKPAVAVLLICVGTAIASVGEMHMSLVGMLIMFGSIYFEAVRLILTQRLLGDKRLHVVEGLYYIAPCSCFFVLLAALFIDVPRLDMPRFWLQLQRDPWTTGTLILAACLLGFAVNTSSFLVIQRTNVIMLKLLSISRNALVVLSGIVFFSEEVTRVQIVGYSITVVFFAVYNYLQISGAAGPR